MEASGLKKRIRSGPIELAKDECAILVNYTVEYVKNAGTGKETVVDRKPGCKRMKVKSLNEYSNIPLLAKDVVSKSKLISSSKAPLVEKLLYELRDREAGKSSILSDQFEEQPLAKPSFDFPNSSSSGEVASIDKLDEYLEKMYDNVLEKVQATEKIAQLAGHTHELEQLLMHEPLIGALARVLREDGRKSIDLSTNILTVFFAISNFSQFHQVVIQNQIGDMTMKLIDLEIQRSEYLEKQEGGSIALLTSKAWVTKSNGGMLSEKQEKVLNIINKQDRFLYIAFYLLLNVSEDVNIEKKIRKRSIILYLSNMLQRNNVELLLLSVTFLKKLSIYKENKEQMMEHGIIGKLAKFIPAKNDSLEIQTLRLLHNLSFDEAMRDEMARNSMIPKLVGLMKASQHQSLVLGLLYHISIEDKSKSMFSFTQALDILHDMLMELEESRTAPELIALAVNLSQNSRNAEILAQGGRLESLIDMAISNEDELLFKIIRNISQQENPDIKLLFKPSIGKFAAALKMPHATQDFLIEVLGTLANLAMKEFQYEILIEEYDLLTFLNDHLNPHDTEDDMLLEAAIFAGTIATEKTSKQLLESDIIERLFYLLREKREDDEIVLQITFALHKLLLFEPSRTRLLSNTDILNHLIDLVNDKNSEVRSAADKALDYIKDVSEEYAIEIRAMKFEAYNQEWIEVTSRKSDILQGKNQILPFHGAEGDSIDYEMDPNSYDHEQYIDGSDIYNYSTAM